MNTGQQFVDLPGRDVVVAQQIFKGEMIMIVALGVIGTEIT